MNAAIIDLTLSRPIRGDLKETVFQVRDRTFERALAELDNCYGGRHWFADGQAVGVASPPGVQFTVIFNRQPHETEGDTSERIMSAFEKHWQSAEGEILG